MVAAVGLTVAVEPPKGGRSEAKLGLKQMIPEQFGDWRPDERSTLLVPSPDVEAGLSVVYQETLTRTYVNSDGQRMMLSIAYTGDIDQQMNLHRPEFCYPAQGFDVVVATFDDQVVAGTVRLPVKKMVARASTRVEPITYWITVGDVNASQGWQRKLARLRYGLTGKVPDGILVRVSSISSDTSRAFADQAAFIAGLLGNMTDASRKRLVGSLAG
jgi:EpsI family protein